ncbi:MAG: Mur ligase family protein, partial [Amphiplicatus sp.]
MADPSVALARIAERRPLLIDLGLDRMHAALERLGCPQGRLPPVFHVAGTNGKGSTCQYIRSILEASGASVHVYTSPHLVRFNERIVLAGAEIEDDHLADVLTRCDREVGDLPLTFFETITCAAFLAFAERRADYLVLEVGLGGKLDATNVIDRPLS